MSEGALNDAKIEITQFEKALKQALIKKKTAESILKCLK